MAICQSRKSTHSVMNNQGYGKVTITRGEHSIEVCEDWLFSNGRIKKYATKLIDNMFAELEMENEKKVG